ncbi:MAG TPA: WecB/TagA/CpsF family glycosyltransferase [Spirochaetota bacterium]|nr:WecB/TagA/CpsF family glycosyltransferase [Spirochaetota bacterium]
MTDKSVYYDSYKEDRDIILEYNQINLKEVGVSNILGMGIDNLTCMHAVAKVVKMIEEGGVHHVINLNPYKLLRYRANRELKTIYNKSSLRFASGAGIQWAAKMLKFPIRERIPFIHFMMELIRISEIKELSIFLVGGKPETAERAFANIKKSFPNIRIVGRHGGFFNPDREKSVVEAIRKSEANIVFVGMGFPKEDRWIAKFGKQFKNVVFISAGGSLDIISGENRKAPEFFTERGTEWFYRILTKPLRIGRFFRVCLFFAHTVLYRIFKSR